MEHITLYYREGSSDKVYQASILPRDNGYMVLFAYGRRGSTLNAGSKTQTPVAYQEAKSIYDKLVKEKMAKGYTAGSDTPQYTQSTQSKGSKQPAGIHCQLLNPVSDDYVEGLIHDRDYWMQEKMDGRRLLIKKEGNHVTGINRLGIIVAVPQSIMESAANCHGDFIIDGEAVGDTLHAFDLLFLGGEDIRSSGFAVRHGRLCVLLHAFKHPHIRVVETYVFPEKNKWFYEFKGQGKEGVVFKHTGAPYIAGRPSSGGTQFKHKFYETASFIVTGVNARRSVSLILFEGVESVESVEGNKVCPAGNVTIPPNHEVPKAGSVVECRYLYAFRESGSIYQPVYLGQRDDIRARECTTKQLKYKAQPIQEAA